MRRASVILSVIFVAACGGAFPHKTPPKNPSPQNLPSPADRALALDGPARSLVFAGVDPGGHPWAASVYRMDLATHSVKRLLAGESSDTLLVRSGDEFLFFNRAFDSLNFRRLRLGAESEELSPQLRMADTGAGDPSAVHYLGGGYALVAHYNAGRLSLVKQATGELVTTLKANWDLPAGTNLKPSGLIAVAGPGQDEERIYVVHQAYAAAAGLSGVNGSQQLFLLSRDIRADAAAGKPELRVVSAADGSMVTGGERVAGIKLAGSFPVALKGEPGQPFLIVSLCSRFMLASSRLAGEPCQSAIESFDPATGELTLVWDTNTSGLYMNGASLGASATEFYAQVEAEVGGEFVKEMVSVRPYEKSYEMIYRYTAGSGGFWASAYDAASKTLFVGDSIASEGGTHGAWLIFREDRAPQRIDIPFAPLSAVLDMGAP